MAVLRSYNHSDVYASTVYGVAMSLVSPTTHAGAQSARNGGNVVNAVRDSARANLPANKKKGQPIQGLSDYRKLLE